MMESTAEIMNRGMNLSMKKVIRLQGILSGSDGMILNGQLPLFQSRNL